MALTTNPVRFAKKLAALALAVTSAVVVSAAFAGTSSAATTPDCTSVDRGNLCVLDPAASGALVAQGGSSLSVDGDVVVDSSSAGAASTSAGSTVVAHAIGGPGGFSGSFSPTPVTVAPQPDPFNGSSVAHGSCSGGDTALATSGPQSAAAGTYSSLGASGSGTLNLAPGVYTITGGFNNSGGGTVNGAGVTLYLCPGATFDISGSSSTTLSSPSGSSGFVIFDDSNGSFRTVGVTTSLVGRIYARFAALSLQNLDVQGDVVANTVLVHSLGVVRITAGPTPPPQPATPSLTTVASGPVTVGGAIHDTAHLSGGSSPTGSITFDVFDSACATKLTTVAATATVSGAGDYVSANYTPAAAGTYKWVAHYSGDANNNKVDSTCGAAGETSTVNATAPSIATTLSAGTVTAGASVHDSATLSGVTANAGGSVTYSVYTNTTCTGSALSAGTTTVTNGKVPDSNTLVFNTAGDFYWQAAYSGDQNNGSATSPCTSEHLIVNAPATPPGGGGGGGGGGTPPVTTTTTTATSAPSVDLAIVKSASPISLLVGKGVTYTLTVTNNGPITDTNVQVSDSLPAGVSFVNVTTSQGTCTGGSSVQCQLGTMTNGQVVTIKIGVTTTATGTIVNVGTVTGALPETTLANNQSSATIRVTAQAKAKPKPFRPPAVVKKKVKSSAPPCYTVAVAPKNLTVGKAGTLQLRVTGKSKPIPGIKVSIKGAGVLMLSGPTNSSGQVTLTLHPTKPGLVSLRAASQQSCNTTTVGVVSAFTPPVTG